LYWYHCLWLSYCTLIAFGIHVALVTVAFGIVTGLLTNW